MREESARVFVVDDDPSIREALDSLLRSVGLGVQTFASAQDFLASKHPDVPGCLVLDVHLPGLSGLDLQQELAKANISRSPSFSSLIAVIFPYVSGLSRQERWSFSLTKPFDHKDLLDAIQQGIARDRRARHGRRDVPLHGFEEIAVTAPFLKRC